MRSFFVQKSMALDGWVDGWESRVKDAYSNQKYVVAIIVRKMTQNYIGHQSQITLTQFMSICDLFYLLIGWQGYK